MDLKRRVLLLLLLRVVWSIDMSSGYSNSVLIGNWTEEKLKNEYDLKIFLRKRDRGELLLQKSRNLFSNLLRERPLAISGTHVCFGFQVQIVASDIHVLPAKGPEPRGMVLSGLVNPRQVDYMQSLSDGCVMTLSPITTPCCRNTFTLISATDDSKYGKKLTYGEEFMLQIADYGDSPSQVKNSPLFVRYVPEGVPAPADRMPIQLSALKDTYCRWKAVPLMPRDRLEGAGSSVEQGTKLVIKNCVADKNLCVMYQSWMQTFFGPECGITLRTYVDIHKRVTAENTFKIVSDIV